MADVQQYDAIIIGSGQAGNPLAQALAKAGKHVALIEKAHIGGTCVNEGCTPTKTMIASARVAYLARRAADYGVRVGQVSVDMTVVRKRKRAIVDEFRSGNEQGLEETDGIDIVRGEGRFIAPKTIEVALTEGGTTQLTAGHIFINVGARPFRPNLPGLDSVAALDSTSIMELDQVPDHLIVLGGGYIAVEFGQMFRRFGSRVTIVERSAQLMGHEDADIAEAVLEILREDGLEVHLNAEALHVAAAAGEQIALTFRDAAGEHTITGSHLLVAAGRTPNTDSLGLDAAGIGMDKRGFVKVNATLETNVEGVFALGDVKGGPAFTHISYDDYRIVAANVLHDGSQKTTGRLVPYTLFIDPQLGRVGLTEADARAQGLKIRIAQMPMAHVARALEMDETRGVMKVVVDAGSEQILGCAILGIEGGELASMIQIAMMGKLPYTALRDGIFSHPTLSEAFNNLFSNFTDEE